MRVVDSGSSATIAQTRAGAGKGGPRTSLFSIGSGDKGTFIPCSGAFPITIAAGAAGLGSTWNMALGNVGTTGYQTLSMADKSLIDGLPSLRIYPGENFELVSDGQKVYTQGRQKNGVLLNTTNILVAANPIDNELGFDDTECNRLQMEIRGVQFQGNNAGNPYGYVKRNGVYQTANYQGTFLGSSAGNAPTAMSSSAIQMFWSSSGPDFDALIDFLNTQATGGSGPSPRVNTRVTTGNGDGSTSTTIISGSGPVQGFRISAGYAMVAGTIKLYGFRG